jgi:hypothetical protein
MVLAAIARAGPGGGPSPDLRVVGEQDDTDEPGLRVTAPIRAGRRVLRILRSDGRPATPDVEGHTVAAAERVVTWLEHIARWQALRSLANPVTALGDAVRIEVLPAYDGERRIPEKRVPLLLDRHGEIALRYRLAGGKAYAPRVFVRLRNTTGRPLWCLLVDLNDRYGADPVLFPGRLVGAGCVGAALEGGAIRVSLPRDRPAQPGAVVRDWLKLVVSEVPLTTLPFHLSALEEPATRTAARGQLLDGLVQPGGPSGLPPKAAPDWATAVVPMVTTVPDH